MDNRFTGARELVHNSGTGDVFRTSPYFITISSNRRAVLANGAPNPQAVAIGAALKRCFNVVIRNKQRFAGFSARVPNNHVQGQPRDTVELLE